MLFWNKYKLIFRMICFANHIFFRVLGHLTDEDLLKFFKRIRIGLSANGLFIIKENVTSNKKVDMDDEDSSVTRPLKQYESILKEAGFKILKITQQKSFPKGLYPVYMLASRPLANST